MSNLVVAFPRQEMASKIKKVLGQSGYNVTAVCLSGTQVLASIDGLESGIIICSYRFRDMVYTEILNDLPEGFQVLLVAPSTEDLDERREQVHLLTVPFHIQDLLQEVRILDEKVNYYLRQMKKRPRIRSDEDQKVIAKAKELLITRRGMTEEEAHRYIQRRSMETGRNLVDMAARIIGAAEKAKKY